MEYIPNFGLSILYNVFGVSRFILTLIRVPIYKCLSSINKYIVMLEFYQTLALAFKEEDEGLGESCSDEDDENGRDEVDDVLNDK